MADDKTCKYCGETGLNWDYEHHANTGKWRLIKHKGCTSGSLRYVVMIDVLRADGMVRRYVI